MKKLLLLLLVLSVKPLMASSLDLIYDAPGDFWGKADASVNNANANHLQFNMEQGIRFEKLLWLTWYVSMTGWQQIGVSRNNYWSYGVKNTTWITHLTLGIEEENYVFSTAPVPTNALVGYASCSFDWNLKGGK